MSVRVKINASNSADASHAAARSVDSPGFKKKPNLQHAGGERTGGAVLEGCVYEKNS